MNNTYSKRRKIFLSFLIILLILTLNAASVFAAAVPSLTAKVTDANILALVKEYSPATYTYLKYEDDHGANLTTYYYSGETIIDSLDTTAHEFCHGYISDKATSWNQMVVPYGDGKEKVVNYTDVFSSKRMAAEIPTSLRTFRYDTYVSANAGDNMGSVQEGIYGLLNEYTAYFNGFRTMNDMKPYLLAKNAGAEYWAAVCRSGANNRVAYAEFKFYQLRYLLYAKSNYPDVYKGILNNSAYCDAFLRITENFEKEIKEYDKLINELKGKGYYLSSSGNTDFMYAPNSSSGFMVYMNKDYDTLMNEMSKSKYTDMMNTVKAHCSVPKATITSLTNTASGVQVKWEKAYNAEGYAVYRRAGSSDSWKYLGSTTGSSYTDTTAVNGKFYQYRLKTKVDGKYGTASGYKSIRRLEGVALSSVKNEKNSISIKWNASSAAKGYDLYRKDGSGSYKKIASITSGSTTSYLDKSISSGHTYTYKIRVKNNSYGSAYSAEKKITRISNPAINEVELSKKGVTLGWTKVSAADGYSIYRKTGSGSYTKLATVSKSSTTSYQDTTIVSGKTYTYYVVAVRDSSRSAASGTLKVTR